MEKKKYNTLRKLLTTASFIALTTGGVNNALSATTFTTNGGNGTTVNLNDGTNTDKAQAMANNDILVYGDNALVNTNSVGALTIADIDINNKTPGVFTVNSNDNITVTAFTKANNNLDLAIEDNASFKVIANADALNNITLHGPNGKFIIGHDATNGAAINGAITANANTDGILVFEGDGSLEKNVGTNANSIGEIHLQGDNTKTVQLDEDVFAKKIIFKGDSNLSHGAVKTWTGDITTEENGKGNIVFTGNNLKINGSVGTVDKHIGKIDFSNNNNSLTFSGDNANVFVTNISDVGNAGQGQVSFIGKGTINIGGLYGDTDRLALFGFDDTNGKQEVILAENTKIYADQIGNFGRAVNNNSTYIFGKGVELHVTGNNNIEIDNGASLILGDEDAKIVNIGNNGDTVALDNAAQLFLSGKNTTVQVQGNMALDSRAKVILTGENALINLKANNNKITLDNASNVTISGKNAIIDAAGAGNVALEFNNAGDVLELNLAEGESAIINGQIDAVGADDGKILVKGKGTTHITGNVGTANNNIGGIEFQEDGILKFADGVTIDAPVTIGVNGAGVENGAGTIHAEGDLILNTNTAIGAINDDKKALKLLEFGDVNNANKTITLKNDAHIRTIKANNLQEGILKLAVANKTTRIGAIENANKFILDVNTDNSLQLEHNYGIETEELNFSTVDLSSTENIEKVTNALAAIENNDKIKEITNSSAAFKILNFSKQSALITQDFTGGNSTLLFFAEGGILSSSGYTKELRGLIVGNNKTLYISGVDLKLHANKDIIVGGANGGSLILATGFEQGRHIKATTANVATLKMVNSDVVEIKSKVGNTAFKTIEFAGNDVKFSNKVETGNAGNNFIFNSDEDRTIEFAAQTQNDMKNAAFINKTDKTATYKITTNNADLSFAESLSAVDNTGINKFVFSAGNVNSKTVDLTNNAYQSDKAELYTAHDTKMKIDLNASGARIGAIGKESEKFEEIKFTENATILKDAYATKFDVQGGKTATFNGKIVGDTLELAANGTAIVSDATLSAGINNAGGSIGIVSFIGSESNKSQIIDYDIGSNTALQKVEFRGTQGITHTIRNDIRANEVLITEGHKVVLEGDKALGDEITINKTGTLDVSDNTLTLGGNLTLNDTPTIALKIFSDNGTTKSGKIDANNNNIRLGYADIKLDITDNDNLLLKDSVTFITGAKNVIAPVDLAKFNTLTSNNKAITVRVMHDSNNNLQLSGKQDSAGFVDFITNQTLAENNLSTTSNDALILNRDILASLDDDINSNGSKSIRSMGKIADNKKQAEALARYVTTAQSTISNNTEVASTNVNNRLISLLDSEPISVEAPISPAAGDDDYILKHGVWGSPFMSSSTQKQRKNNNGYKSKIYGGAFGADSMINDRTTIGAAFTFASNNVKHKDLKSGDKTDVNSYIFSLYGVHKVTDALNIQAILSMGTNTVKNNTTRIDSDDNGNAVNTMARGKYNVVSTSGDFRVAYTTMVSNNISLTPTIGVRYTHAGSSSYTEKGTTDQLQSVSIKPFNKFEGLLGAKIATTMEYEGMFVTPNLHANLAYDFTRKDAKVVATTNGLDGNFASNASKPTNMSCNVGFGANVSNGAFEYSLSYDLNLGKKYVGHQGALKLRVNF